MTAGKDPTAPEAYDELADAYVEEVEASPYNADFAIPGTTALIPEVTGKRVIDAGCGAGAYTAWLVERGADVVGVDASRKMLDRAIERIGDRAEFHQADLGRPLDFAADQSFDGIVCALALDYVENWSRPFSEFARLLTPGGFVVF